MEQKRVILQHWLQQTVAAKHLWPFLELWDGVAVVGHHLTDEVDALESRVVVELMLQTGRQVIQASLAGSGIETRTRIQVISILSHFSFPGSFSILSGYPAPQPHAAWQVQATQTSAAVM
jgi:hypothetical protein